MITSFSLLQLEYVVAVDNWRHFALAAEKCFITQPTLSMQIQKLERDLGVLLFDRSKQPVIPTEAGVALIEQAKIILKEAARIPEMVSEMRGKVEGEIRLGIIPTIAPYLIPLFINKFLKKYPGIKLIIHELITEEIIDRLKKGQLDAGLLSTPLEEKSIREEPLFYEEFVVYLSKDDKSFSKKYLLPKDIDVSRLWLLEEGHCFRSQIMNLCELRKASGVDKRFDYETGSIETLKMMVELNHGITILPELSVDGLSKTQKKMVRRFKDPAPVREVSIVTHRNFIKIKIITALKEEILNAIPEIMKSRSLS
ncbi:MAG: LysR substrate-binding domain-containing protein [Bacteroidota bacterium]|nr:LysR substrate-binding domain-containing protein [Bacteroidota bacterium]